MTPFYHRPWCCLGSLCTVPSCTAQYIHNHRSLVVMPPGETPGLFPPRFMAPFSPLTSPHQPLSYLPAFPLLSRPALVSYHRLLGLRRPVTTFTFTSSRYFSPWPHTYMSTTTTKRLNGSHVCANMRALMHTDTLAYAHPLGHIFIPNPLHPLHAQAPI